ncbi:MAG: alpha-L-fucosidase [Candidatus Aminicenantes bacterium RBG_16_63_16]|nr:MAG: alpha-L-fucosidase [Candidatus Aminicenantes bacterium RBG_16_63_16]
MKILISSFLLVSALALLVPGQAATAPETESQREARLKWWTEARFGMFIHWGLYALPARHEWVKNHEKLTDAEYQKYFEHFNPDLFNPQEWARLAKQAGMRYFVITTKHHEGFCLWDSKYTDYKATNTPYGKDLIKPMVEAFRAEGLHAGFYHSLLDWHHPDYPVDRNHPMFNNLEFRKSAANRDVRKYAEYLHNQVRELLTRYGPVDTLFMDYSFPGENGKGRNDWQSEKLLKMIRELQPQIIVDDRLDLLDVPGGWDYRTPEQTMPREWVSVDGKPVPWETCQTFSGSWGYHRDEATWKSIRQLVVMLIETVSKGGNLLLNVGPTARGTFDERAKERLEGIGAWMKEHNRSIYGCTQAPADFKAPQNCLLTYNPAAKRLYVHVLEWPMGVLHLDGFAGRVAYAQLLNDASEVKFSEEKGSSEAAASSGKQVPSKNLNLQIPVRQPNVTVPVIELYLK